MQTKALGPQARVFEVPYLSSTPSQILMIKLTLHPEPLAAGSSQEGLLEISNFPIGAAKSRYASHFVNIDRRSPSDTVFHLDDNTFTSSLPRASHWSIAWSDLMMTMFILFLSMYVYQTANQEFLVKKTPEIIGGDTTEALQSLDSSGAAFPFAPIHPGLPLITGGTVKKIEQEKISQQDLESIYTDDVSQSGKNEPEGKQEQPTYLNNSIEENLLASTVEIEENPSFQDTIAQTPAPSPELEEIQPPASDQFQEIFNLSTVALKANNLGEFAAIDIIPDKTMRIILTGDLLFDLGESDLSEDARSSLQKIVAVVRHTPYMINIVGHTDNLPMRSNRFKSNWELSVARASTVARFLIDEMNMNPGQFVVSGYSSNRPIVPNTTTENRAKNRRVEIIISKRLPNPLPATAENLE